MRSMQLEHQSEWYTTGYDLRGTRSRAPMQNTESQTLYIRKDPKGEDELDRRDAEMGPSGVLGADAAAARGGAF